MQPLVVFCTKIRQLILLALTWYCCENDSQCNNNHSQLDRFVILMANPNWIKGVSGNPSGRPPSFFSGFSDRAGALLEKLTRQEILDISDDSKKLNKYSSFDCLIIRQLANALRAGDIGKRINKSRNAVIGKARRLGLQVKGRTAEHRRQAPITHQAFKEMLDKYRIKTW